MYSDDLRTPGSAAPRCPAAIEIATFLVALASAVAIPVLVVAYPLLHIRHVPYMNTLTLGSPIALLCLLNIAAAFYTQKGNIAAYYGLVTILSVISLALLLRGLSPVPAMVMMLFLLLGYTKFVAFWDYQQYMNVVNRYQNQQAT